MDQRCERRRGMLTCGNEEPKMGRWSIISPRMKCEERFSLGGLGRDDRKLETLSILEGEAEQEFQTGLKIADVNLGFLG
jgi:hypothetical protein